MRRQIYYFITASFAIHVAALLVLLTQSAADNRIIPASTSSAPSISVALLPNRLTHKPQHQQHSEPRPVKHTPRLRATTPLPATPPKPEQTQQHSKRPSTAKQIQQAELHRIEVRDRVLSRLQINLRRYISYPPLARRQGWQGRVLLAFSIEADGNIRNIHVAAGSGHAILDSSAVAALTELQRLQPAASWTGQRLELQLPVIYRLQGG